MEYQLRDRTCLVSGASSGIGAGVVRLLSQQGARLTCDSLLAIDQTLRIAMPDLTGKRVLLRADSQGGPTVVGFNRGDDLSPPPPEPSKHGGMRYYHVTEADLQRDIAQGTFAQWVRQAAKLPGEKM